MGFDFLDLKGTMGVDIYIYIYVCIDLYFEVGRERQLSNFRMMGPCKRIIKSKAIGKKRQETYD